jgi:hypothetical protein
VWTSDLGLVRRARRALCAGFKVSGHGKMLGAALVGEMTQIKSVWMKVEA